MCINIFKEKRLKKTWMTSNRRIISIFAFFVVMLYLFPIFGFSQYMPEHIDDAWTLSWAHNWWSEGEIYDPVFGYLDGDGGTSLFSRSYVYVYGAILQFFDWTRGGAFLLSTIFLIGSAFLWKSIIKKLGYPSLVSWLFLLVLLSLETYFAAAHKTRVEALTFFLSSLAFWCFVKEHYFFSGFIAILAGETHPYGAVSFMYILGYCVLLVPRLWPQPKLLIKNVVVFLSGMALGIGYYLLLHGVYLSQAESLDGRIGGNVIWAYLFGFRFSWRHLPEALIWMVALGSFLAAQRWKTDRFLLPFLVLTILFSVIFPRGNFHYMIYLYPPLILLILTEAKHRKLTNWLVLGLLLFLLPQYIWLHLDQRGYDHEAYVQSLREAVSQEQEIIYGHPNSWFAFYDREFYGPGYFSRANRPIEEWPSKMVVIENALLNRTGGEELLDIHRDAYDWELLTELNNGPKGPTTIWHIEKRFSEVTE